MIEKSSIRLFEVIALSILGIVETGYSQTDNQGTSASYNSYAKITPTSISTAKEKTYSDKISKAASAADSVWNAMPQWEWDQTLNREQGAIFNESFALDYLKSGYRFWQMFPEDKRKYEWLKNATGVYLPHFWMNIEQGARDDVAANGSFYSSPIDMAAKNKWMGILKDCGRIFLNDPQVSKEEKGAYKVDLVYQLLNTAYNRSFRGPQDEFFTRLNEALDVAVADLDEGSRNSSRFLRAMNTLTVGSTRYTGNMENLKTLVDRLSNCEQKNVRKWALQKSLLLNANIQNFQLFNIPAIKGIDVENFRDKVVLIDFWNLHCSTCIARMPIIKSAYDKYRAQGFEVLSVSTDPKSKKDKVDEVIKKVGVDWKHMIIGGDGSPSAPWHEISKRYGFMGVPQMVLFNKKGELALINGPLILDKDVNELIRILAEE